jgi:bifunctional ADP-heptose synthase (sugar kinase/adenylyltransferase)
MSTLKLGTIATQDGTESTEVTNVVNGSAKAWVNFDGTQAAASMIRASFNVTSVTDNGTGDYTVNFATAMTDANYSMAGTCAYTITGASMVLGYYGTNPTVSAARVQVWNPPNNTRYDAVFCQIAFFR